MQSEVIRAITAEDSLWGALKSDLPRYFGRCAERIAGFGQCTPRRH